MCDHTCVHQSDESNYEEVEKIVEFLATKTKVQPKVGIMCGTGLEAITSIMRSTTVVKYSEIPKFPATTVPGHIGELYFGYVGPVPVVCMKGRFHFYEGYSLWKCTLPIRMMKLLGVDILIISNSAGGINNSYRVGDLVFIKDHINFLSLGGHSPLRGPNEEKFGPRFVDISDAYDKELLKIAKATAKELKIRYVQEGVYACVGGPNFETVAELKALKILGADCVGMSTVHEVIVARHCGIRCFAFSLITNKCGLDYESDHKTSHTKHLKVGEEMNEEVKGFVERFITLMNERANIH